MLFKLIDRLSRLNHFYQHIDNNSYRYSDIAQFYISRQNISMVCATVFCVVFFRWLPLHNEENVYVIVIIVVNED